MTSDDGGGAPSRDDGGTPTGDPDAEPTDDARSGESGVGLDVDGADLLERTIVVASVLLVLGTFGYVGWQVTFIAADGAPTATVEAVEPMPAPDDDRRRVTVRLDNRRGAGLSSVAVAVACGGAERSVSFAHVPAGGRRTGTVVCPAGSDPDVEVVKWVAA